MKKNKEDRLRESIEKSLTELLGGKSTKTVEERAELRANLKLAMQFRAIEAKIGEEEYGSGFTNGRDDEKQPESDDDD